MKKLVLPILALSLTLPSYAGVLDTLKKQPATKYELGKMQLELGAYMFTQELKSRKLPNSNFKIENFRVDEKDGKLYFVVSSVGKAKDMNQETCQGYSDALSANKAFSDAIYSVWGDLSPVEMSNIKKEVMIAVELVSKENEQFKITCS